MAKRSRLVRDIGELGQDHFKVWCTDNRLSAVSAKPDKLGWDYFVEFEPEVDEAVPLDRQDDLAKVLVQVKSSETASQSVRGKLSALKRLVDTDLPAFVAFLDYGDQPRPRRARLLHIGPTQIEQVLRKVRQTEKEGRIDIQNVRMSLSLAEAVEIGPDGANLRDLITAAIPQSPAEYAAAKAGFRKTCGYDEHSIRAHFSLAEGLEEDALVDLMLGKVPHVPVRAMVVTKERFGIALDNDTDHLTEGLLSVEVKPLQQGRVMVVGPDDSRRVSMKVGVFAPGIPGLSKRNRKVRLANKFLDVMLHLGEGRCTFTFRIDPDKRLPIEQLAEALAFGSALAEEGAKLEVDVGAVGMTRMTLPTRVDRYRSWRVLHEFVDLLAVACFRHRRGSVVETSLSEMEKALDDNHNMFATLARPGLALTFGADENTPRDVPTRGALYMPLCIEFASLVYFAIARVEAREIACEQNGALRFVGDLPRVVEDGVIERSALRLSTLNERAAALGQTESSKGWAIVTTSLADPDVDEPS